MLNQFTIREHRNYEVWYFQVHFGIHAMRVEWTRDKASSDWQVHTYLFHSKGDLYGVHGHQAAPNWLETHTTRAGFEDLAWDLSFQPASSWMSVLPDSLEAAQIYDVQLKHLPLVVFSGTITIGSKEYKLDAYKGSVGHYFGRKAAENWWWLQATDMEESGYHVSALAMRSGLLGSKPVYKIGYVHIETPHWTRHITAPLARLSIQGGQPSLHLTYKPLFDQNVEIRFSGEHFLHPRPGIRLTLLGDLYVYMGGELVCHCLGKAAAERRLVNAKNI